MLSFKWRYFKLDMILMLVRWYLVYLLSYRNVEELALQHELKVGFNSWMINYAPLLEAVFRKPHNRPVGIYIPIDILVS